MSALDPAAVMAELVTIRRAMCTLADEVSRIGTHHAGAIDTLGARVLRLERRVDPPDTEPAPAPDATDTPIPEACAAQ